MKNIYSLIACCIVSVILLQYRVSHSDIRSELPLKVTTWDALGYYMYLPSIFIYQDITELKWLPEIDKQYSLSGGDIYQAQRHENGKYVFKYLGGVSIMEMPFFLIGHVIAINTKYKADGFSPPYQYSIAFGAVIYCILAIFLLRRLLLRFFSDRATAISLLLLVTATNLIQYVSIDGAMSHSYIFPLYVLIIYVTIKWHTQPSILWASLIGLIIGLATICRPTEAIMLFIPLLWNTQTKKISKEKWLQVKKHKSHLLYVLIFGLIGVLPQLIYWKISTGGFVYSVGSKWVFLNPFFRVLFGWESGWFIYTPITILFIIGLFFMKQYSFKKSIIVFCILNIWIITSWFDWRYGATYSTRALVQSYPILAFPFTAVIERITLKKWRFIFYLLGGYLLYVNVFQLNQYFNTVLHYRDMNRAYYAKIYLNSNPSPLDMSLLDTDEVLNNDEGYNKNIIASSDTTIKIMCVDSNPCILFEDVIEQNEKNAWIKVKAEIKVQEGFFDSYLNCKLQFEDSVKHKKVRLFNPISQSGKSNLYEFYVQISNHSNPFDLTVFISSTNGFIGEIEKIKLVYLTK